MDFNAFKKENKNQKIREMNEFYIRQVKSRNSLRSRLTTADIYQQPQGDKSM